MHGDGSDLGGIGLRESAYRVFAGCPNLVMDLQTDAVLIVSQWGLQDGYSVEARFSSLSLYNVLLTVKISAWCSSRISHLSDRC